MSVEVFAAAGAATVYEAAGGRGAMDWAICSQIGHDLAVAGPARTVACHPGDNLGVHQAVAVAEPGEILVVAGGGVPVGYLGDILAEAARVRGVVAAIIDGAVRDLAALRNMPFPVWARGPAIHRAAKEVSGTLGEPTECGGVLVCLGDLIVADSDGVVVVPRATLDDVRAAVGSRVAAEEELRRELRQGALTLDLLGLR